MPVVHSSANAFKTAGVVTQGPSSNVSTTSWSRRKSSCLKCSKPNPGPPVVSISTTRPMPSASGFVHAALERGAGAEDGAGLVAAAAVAACVPCACGDAVFGAAACDHATSDTHNEPAPAKIKPAANRICYSPKLIPRSAVAFQAFVRAIPAPQRDSSLVG